MWAAKAANDPPGAYAHSIASGEIPTLINRTFENMYKWFCLGVAALGFF